jgi:predicted component of type VI protein secretion system
VNQSRNCPARALLAGCALCLVIAGCGSSHSANTKTHAAGASAPTTASTAAPATTTATTTTSATSAATAAPGTKLRIGQSAVVRFETMTQTGKTGPVYRLRVTVQSLQQGTISDFKGIQLDAAEKAGTPDYVKVSMTNLGPGKLGTSNSDPAVAINGVDNTGNNQDSVTFFGDFPPCNDVSTPNPLAQGQSFQTCLTFLVPHGIKAVSFIGSNAYLDAPVVWSQAG